MTPPAVYVFAMRRGPPGQVVVLLVAILALLYGVATAFMPAMGAELEPEARSLDCAALRTRVDAWRAAVRAPVRVRVRSTELAVIGSADGEMRGVFACGGQLWPATHLPTVGAPGQRLALAGDTTVTIELQRDGLWVVEVCGDCGERAFRRRHTRTPAEVEAARPLGFALTALSTATLLGLLVWWIVRRRSADTSVA